MLTLFKRPSVRSVSLIALGILLVYVFSIRPLTPFEALQFRMHDFFFVSALKAKRPPPELDQIVLVALDDESYTKVNERWPWDRAVYAELVEKLSRQNPRLILLDVAFGGEQNPESDTRLAAALEKAGNVFIAYYLGDNGRPVYPLGRFRKASLGSGYVNKPLDADFSIRQAQLLRWTVDGELLDMALELKAASHLFSATPVPSREKQIIQFQKKEGSPPPPLRGTAVPIPVRRDGTVFLNYQASREDFTTVPAWKVLAEEVPEGTFKDKIALFGITNRLMHDIHHSPLGSLPGVVIFANLLLMILSGAYVFEAPLWVDLFVLSFLGMATAYATYRLTPWRGFLFFFYAVLFLLGVTFFLYLKNIHWDFAGTLFAMVFCYLGITFYKYFCVVLENAALKEEAITDGLTQLYTYRYFELRLRNEFERASRYHVPLSLVFVDVDHFKRINDTYGHEEGNIVLRAIAELLRKHSRRVDLVARYGGEEFCVILPQTELEGAEHYAEFLRKAVEESPISLRGGETIRVTISLGVSSYPRFPVTSSEELVKLTDLGVYQAKQTGRNQVCVAGSSFLKTKAEKP